MSDVDRVPASRNERGAIPDDYTCTGDGCWWEVEYNYVGLVKDTTTWTAYVDGNPIRIVE